MSLFEENHPPEPAAATDEKVYYSTPFGDTKDGGQRLFLLLREGVRYLPVFRSVESMRECFERMNRGAYMNLKGDVQKVLDTNRSIELMKAVGIVIEPFSEHPVLIAPPA